MDASGHEPVLVVRTASRACALPVGCVEEVMRPLRVDEIPGAPAFVQGLSVIRGAPVPVLDLGRILGAGEESAPGRYVVLRLKGRRAALAVESVAGLRDLNRSQFWSLSRILDAANTTHLVAGVGRDDRDLLFVLEAVRIIPDGLWKSLESLAVKR